MPHEEPVTPLDIQFRLRKRGVTQKALALKYGKSEMAISDVINFRMVSKPLMIAISREIDLAPEVAFAWYFNSDNPRRRSRAVDAA